jgi:Arc/MetJ-type ribon-helix-helix transcriptional regulator
MNIELSPQSEQYLASVVAGGIYPSKQAALEAAVAALRERDRPIQMIPEEHMALVEAAIESSLAGKSSPMTPADWEMLRQLARDTAAKHGSENR